MKMYTLSSPFYFPPFVYLLNYLSLYYSVYLHVCKLYITTIQSLHYDEEFLMLFVEEDTN